MDQPTAAAPQELQNEFVRFTIHQKPACIIEFNVEALEPLISKAHKHALKSVSKEVAIAGFRKGKVPEALISKNFPKELDKELQQAIADESLRECQKLAKIRLLHRDAKITYTMKSHSSTGALLTLLLETEPKIPHVDPKNMRMKAVKRPEVTEEKINETIRQAQLFFATWHAVTNRPVQVNDFVSLNVEVIENTPAVPLFSNTRFEVTEKAMSKWMFDLVIGKNQGDVIEGISTPDETASDEEKEELTAKKVRLTILSIDTATLPELTDEFVKQMGVKTVDEMRVNITNLLNKQADEHLLEEQRKQVSEFLLKECPFDLPVTLIEKETEFRFRQLWQDESFQTYWKGLNQEERQKIIRTVHEQSEKAVRMFYLCRQIVADANIAITSKDVPAAAEDPLNVLLNLQDSSTPRKSPEIEHAEAYSKLILEKAEDFIIRNATQV